MRSLLRLFVAATLVAAPVLTAHADTAVYTVSGLATGTIGSTAFTNALVTMTATDDTSTIASLGSVGSYNSADYTVTIDGVGTGTLTDTSTLYVIAIRPPMPQPGRSSNAGFQDFNGFFVFGVYTVNSFDGYDLSTSIGPITDNPIVEPMGVMATTLGDLNFTSAGDLTFTAVVTPSSNPSPVPEPSSLALLGTGVLSVVGGARRKLFA